MKLTTLTLLLASLALSARAELKLPAIIGDNMVLQQKQTNPLWGWDTPGTEVTVTFAGQTKSAQGRCGRQVDGETRSPCPRTRNPRR
jgi:sialate O-acetylesterase